MAFNIEYVKENTIPHIDALSRLKFSNETLERSDNPEDKILDWIETDVLLLDHLTFETLQDPILSKIACRIK